MQGPWLGFSVTCNTGWQPIPLDAALTFVSPWSAPRGVRCLEFIKLETASDFSVLVKMTVINHETLFCSWEREKKFILFLKTFHLIVCFPFPPGQNWIQLMMNPKTVDLLVLHSLCDEAHLSLGFSCRSLFYVFSVLSLGEFKWT